MVSGTYFLNIGNQQYTKALNQINPALQVQYQNQLNQQVANPFYHYLNPTLMPGPLYNQQTVSLGSLLVPYPQYGGLYELGDLGAAERYQSVELKAQKAFSKGYNFLVTYVYIREKAQTNGFLNGSVFNDQQWYSNTLTYQDSNQPHHRFNIAGTWELPIGKGKPYLERPAQGGGCHRGRLEACRSLDIHVRRLPAVRQPDRHRQPLHFQSHAAALVQHGGVLSDTRQHLRSAEQSAAVWLPDGSAFLDLDGNLTKSFNITERVHAELKMAAYNATNRLNRGDPDTGVYDSTFGQALYQGSPGGIFGAQGGDLRQPKRPAGGTRV